MLEPILEVVGRLNRCRIGEMPHHHMQKILPAHTSLHRCRLSKPLHHSAIVLPAIHEGTNIVELETVHRTTCFRWGRARRPRYVKTHMDEESIESRYQYEMILGASGMVCMLAVLQHGMVHSWPLALSVMV